ncbi:Hypothetical predicted protein, partial [Prunus dulcis]
MKSGNKGPKDSSIDEKVAWPTHRIEKRYERSNLMKCHPRESPGFHLLDNKENECNVQCTFEDIRFE